MNDHDDYTEITNQKNLEPVSQKYYNISQFEYNFKILESILEWLLIPNFQFKRIQQHFQNIFDATRSMDQTIETLKEENAYKEQLIEQLETATKFPNPLVVFDIEPDCKVEVFNNQDELITTLRGESHIYPVDPGDRFRVSRDIEYERKRLGNEIRSLHQEIEKEKGSTLEELSNFKLEKEKFSINDPNAEAQWPSKQDLDEKYPLYTIDASSLNLDYKIPEDLDAFEQGLKSEDIHQPDHVKDIYESSYHKGWAASEKIRRYHHMSEEFPVTPMQFATMIDALTEMNRLLEEEEAVARYLMLEAAFIGAKRGIDFDGNIF